MSEHGAERRIVLAGVAGHILEWYDFSVYGFFAVAIARNYFPAKNPTTSLIEAFGVFGAGFLVRPVGALLFGYLGDRRGREIALTLSGHGDGGADISYRSPAWLSANWNQRFNNTGAAKAAAGALGWRRVYNLGCFPGREMPVASARTHGSVWELRRVCGCDAGLFGGYTSDDHPPSRRSACMGMAHTVSARGHDWKCRALLTAGNHP